MGAGRRLTYIEQVKLKRMRKFYTHIGHEVLTLDQCFSRFGWKAMYGIPESPKPLFVVGPIGYYSSDDVERVIYEGEG